MHASARVPSSQMCVYEYQAVRSAVYNLGSGAIRDTAAVARRHLDHSDPTVRHHRPLYALAEFMGTVDRVGCRNDHWHQDRRVAELRVNVFPGCRQLQLSWLYSALYAGPKPTDRHRPDAHFQYVSDARS